MPTAVTTQETQNTDYVTKHSIETQTFNDNSLTTDTTTKTDTKQASNWKDWLTYLSKTKNPDIDNTSYADNTIDDRMKNAAEYFGNNVFTLEVEKFSLVRCFEKITNFWNNRRI